MRIRSLLLLFLLTVPAFADRLEWVPQQCVNGRCTPGHWITIVEPKPAAEAKVKSPGCECKECKCEKCVCPPPVLESVVYQGPLPTGVVKSGLSPEPKYTFQGKPIDRLKAFDILGGSPASDLVDDSRKLTVSVIGADKIRKETLTALKFGLGDGYKFWEGEPGDWSFETGFVTSGNPVTIYCQSPDGKVLHRQDDLDGGTQAAIEAIRKANPNYKSSADPDKRKADLPAAITNNFWLFALGGLAIFLFISNKKEVK